MTTDTIVQDKIAIITLHFLQQAEGCRLHAYKDSAGVPTIGYGHTKDVHIGMTITQAEADSMLLDELSVFENGVKNMLRVQLNDNQISALVSFAYNVGLTALRNSTLLQYVNDHRLQQAADQFLVWNKVTRSGVKVVCSGLENRRKAERALFLS
jgi:GH24 family phage-related lysozyme (muramidase)